MFFKMIVFIAAIDSIKFSSKSELSSRFFGHNCSYHLNSIPTDRPPRVWIELTCFVSAPFLIDRIRSIETIDRAKTIDRSFFVSTFVLALRFLFRFLFVFFNLQSGSHSPYARPLHWIRHHRECQFCIRRPGAFWEWQDGPQKRVLFIS